MTGRLADGLYEEVVTGALARDLSNLESSRTPELQPLESADAHSVLARHLAREVERALASVPQGDRPTAQITVVNRLLDELRALTQGEDAENKVEEPGKELRSIHRAAAYERPKTPLATSTLLTRNLKEPNLGGELAREVASSDRIDVLVAFITIGGVRLLRDSLEAFARRGSGALRLRVLTTVFTGTTELAAVEMLASLPGAEVKVSYDTRRTRLHAKAWLFYRDTGLHTAYIGSANFTSTALGSGQEWMVKACAADMPDVVEKFKGTFESLWNDSEFEPFVPGDVESRARLRAALSKEETPEKLLFFSLRPLPFQEEILDQLATQRAVHGRYRNLVVAATGTGKTVVAAFDYERQIDSSQVRPRLLFLAHRKELLDQARTTFRQVLHDGAFGEMLADGEEPEKWDHVFATVQSAVSRDVLGRLGAEHFQFVVVDECHHSPAESYRALIPALRPRILLGLTATPERADGKSLCQTSTSTSQRRCGCGTPWSANCSFRSSTTAFRTIPISGACVGRGVATTLRDWPTFTRAIRRAWSSCCGSSNAASLTPLVSAPSRFACRSRTPSSWRASSRSEDCQPRLSTAKHPPPNAWTRRAACANAKSTSSARPTCTTRALTSRTSTRCYSSAPPKAPRSSSSNSAAASATARTRPAAWCSTSSASTAANSASTPHSQPSPASRVPVSSKP
jgi:HKD family nuclease